MTHLKTDSNNNNKKRLDYFHIVCSNYSVVAFLYVKNFKHFLLLVKRGKTDVRRRREKNNKKKDGSVV